MTVTIDDRTGARVPANIVFFDEANEAISVDGFCESTTVNVPSNAVKMVVDLDPVFPQLDQPFPPVPCPVMGTQGTIQAAWSSS